MFRRVPSGSWVRVPSAFGRPVFFLALMGFPAPAASRLIKLTSSYIVSKTDGNHLRTGLGRTQGLSGARSVAEQGVARSITGNTQCARPTHAGRKAQGPIHRGRIARPRHRRVAFARNA